jgi:hypothetical protein
VKKIEDQATPPWRSKRKKFTPLFLSWRSKGKKKILKNKN